MRKVGIGLGLAGWFFWLVLLNGSLPAAEPAVQMNQSLVILREAMELSRDRGLHPPDEARATARAVRAYLSTLEDPYSTYLSREELQALENMDRPDYAGVGLEVIQAARKGIFCVPFDAGPAHIAGIQSGDRLLAVNGESVAEASLEMLPPLVRGQAGTTVVLTVAGPDGREREAKVIRAQVSRPVVESNFDGDMSKIRIYRFTRETPDLVAQGLQLDPDRGKVIIDLRGNIGGELEAAVSTAALFLPPGRLVASVVGRPGSARPPARHLVSLEGGKYSSRKIVIWQDQMTASASELFIAALTHHGVAVTIGRRTFGKGLVQGQFPASGGGLYIITTGELLTPDGISFNNQGLPPRLLIRNSARDGDYFIRTAEAFTVYSEIMADRKNPFDI